MKRDNFKELPSFPNFEPIGYEHKIAFEMISNKFEVYSDFNFNSFFSWDVDHKNCISMLNGNLIIQLTDYITGEPVISLIGETAVEKTIHRLLKHSMRNEGNSCIKLVPQATRDLIKNENNFLIYEDFDNHDYLFSIEDLATLNGQRYKSKRRGAQKCAETGEIEVINSLLASEYASGIIKFLDSWEETKKQQGKDVDMEYERVAIERMLGTHDAQENVILTCAFKDRTVVGFSIDELLPGDFALSHYFKTLPSVAGLSEYLNREVARCLLELGGKIWNWEQDLGIKALRTMKESHRPIAKQKKYTISLKI